MVRNCVIALVLWITLVAGYAIAFLREIPFPMAILLGSVVWIGLVMIHGARYAWRDWSARNRLARGERPRDGELVSAVGPLRPHVGEVLHAPFSGRECVLYTYDVGGGRARERSARDYAGFGLTRCAVHTPYGSFAIGSFPVLENVPSTPADPARTAEYIAVTKFEPFPGVAGIVKEMFALHEQKPPLKIDWQIGEPTVDLERASIAERVIAPGETVTAIGRYDAASNSIVSDTKDQGFLRMRLGGHARSVSAFPGEAVGKALGGLFFAIVPNVVLWYYLTHVR